MAIIDDIALQELRIKHGRILVLDDGESAVVLRRPTRAEFSRLMTMTPGDTFRVSENLLAELAVFPERAVLNAMFDEKPGLILAFGAKALEAFGAAAQVTIKN